MRTAMDYTSGSTLAVMGAPYFYAARQEYSGSPSSVQDFLNS
jgi:hypothetical protein